MVLLDRQAFVGRLLMGLGFGLASVATPSYLSEVVVPVPGRCGSSDWEGHGNLHQPIRTY